MKRSLCSRGEALSCTNTSRLLLLLWAALAVVGCSQQTGEYRPLSTISRDGFARDSREAQALNGRQIHVWGFVDHGNLYGDRGAAEILGEWWSGNGPDDETWRFNLKANVEDSTGQSMPVYVPNDPGRDDLLRTFLADAQAQKPTRVYVTGTLFTFDAPLNTASRVGLYMKLDSSTDILLALPDEK